MNTITRHVQARTGRSIVGLALAGAILAAPAYAVLADPALASAAPTTTTLPLPTRSSNHGGPDYWSITGARVGAPSEGEVSIYGGSHKHLWVEQQLYGPGVVEVPHVDTTVHQSR
jgi:hypothetical protein